ncbi:MAG: recombinase family protein [Candidatus Magasanikiibacteriota bacterium]
MTTTQDLYKMIGTAQQQEEDKDDVSKYRYVIYARKSTDDKEKQIRSLGDQIKECKDYAERNGLRCLPKPITESESAKEPDIRPEFKKLIDDIKKAKYDGILAWHPDRLARNMKDAGEIIDLLDKKIVKDLKFVTFTFENNTMGKMLLGMAFVLSKQYSDALSDNVKRGTSRSIEEGRWLNKAKHGYYKDRNQILHPDGRFFNLIENIFRMRIDNKSLDDIADYLNENRYCCAPPSKNEADRSPFQMTKQIVSKIVRDPFYTGILKYGENKVDLTEIYDFTPAVSVDDFLKINNFSDIEKALKLTGKIYKDNAIKADLMRGMIICGECDGSMTSGITPKKTKNGKTNYFYYRCDNPVCKNKGKSIRAKVIIDFACQYLEKNKFTSHSIYGHYIQEMKKVVMEKERSLIQKIRSLTETRVHKKNQFEKTKKSLIQETDEDIKGFFKEDLKQLEKDINNLETEIDELKDEKERNNSVTLTYSEYLELFNNLAERIKKIGVMEDLNFIMKKIFLNFTIKEGKVALYTLNSPFGEFVKDRIVLTCRGERT